MKKSQEWKAAEWEYCELIAKMSMPGLWGRPTPAAVSRRLKSIADQWPQFYPALLDLGLRLLMEKGNRKAEKMLEKGFEILVESGDRKLRDKAIDSVIGQLEELWRFDISRRLLEQMAEHRRLSAESLDSLAHATSSFSSSATQTAKRWLTSSRG